MTAPAPEATDKVLSTLNRDGSRRWLEPRLSRGVYYRRRLVVAWGLIGLFVVYGLSGYGVYLWRKSKGRPTSVISTSTDEPDERGLHD